MNQVTAAVRYTIQMSNLAESFRVLRGAQGVWPWDQHKLDQWAVHCADGRNNKAFMAWLADPFWP